MFGTLKTLVAGANARAEEHLRDHYSIELIEQKIREATQGLKSAKLSLAGLIHRKRSEEQQLETLKARIEDLSDRTRQAVANGEDDLAYEAAQAIARMEAERDARMATLEQLEKRVLRLEASVQAASRRLTDLKQGAIAAKAVRREQQLQSRLGHNAYSSSSLEEAEELIANVMSRDDPFETSEILSEINENLSGEQVLDRLAEKGFGPAGKTTASDVLARFK